MKAHHKRLCDRLKEFQHLKKNHEVQARTLFHELKAEIDKHFAWEEEILFPMIERRTGLHMPGPATITRAEHQQIRKLLKEIDDRVVNKEKRAEELEDRLVERLLSHEKEEERILHPWIEASLGEEEKDEALGKIRMGKAKKKKNRTP